MADPTNSEIAEALDELGDLSELDGAVIYRIVAYRNAAKAIRDATVSVTALAREGRATELAGVGAIIQEKVLALADDGEIPATVKLRAKFPAGLLELTHLPGLGPKRARRLYEELGIDSLDALQQAATAHRIRDLKGFGPKAEQTLLAAAQAARDRAADSNGAGRRTALDRALTIADQLVAALREHEASERVELAGSARRMTDSVKDLDVIATAHDPLALATAASQLELVESSNKPGDAGVRLRTHTGLDVDLRIVSPDQFGNLLQHFTGSKQHNMALRAAAVRKGLHVSEYGVLDDMTGETHRCESEQQVYALLGMDYIDPELRENRGELEAAARHELPVLIDAQDLRGDLHSHTTASDGTASIEEMARAARAAGYHYLAITDHSAVVGTRLDPGGVREKIEGTRSLWGTDEVDGIELLAGSEVNIAPDGSLDYDDDVLAELDWVVASVHSSFAMDAKTMTARIVRAIENPLVDVIGHLTGRKIEQRPSYELDFETVLEAAARSHTMLEINSSPARRDLDDPHARAAAQAGVGIVINSDAHRTGGFAVVRYGIATARRAWLGPEAVLNTRPWAEVSGLRPQALAGAA